MDFDYNTGIFGTVKAGKSTIVNSIYAKLYSTMRVVRETMTPQTYKFNANNFGDAQLINTESQIREQNQQMNNLYRNQWDGETRAIYRVNSPPDFINMDSIINISITDLPGLNDRDQSQAYMQWARDKFHMFDCVILPIDIQARFNSSQDKEVCNLVFEKMSEPQNVNINLIIIINKCDDMDPDRQIVRKGYKPVQDEIMSFLNESFTRYNIDESRVRIVLYSSLNVYHFRLIRHNTYEYIKLTLDQHDSSSDEDEDTELTTIMGNIVGRDNWLRMNDDEKRAEIEKLKNSPHFDEIYIKKYGYFQLRKAINDFLSPEHLAKFFKKVIDQCIETTQKQFESQSLTSKNRYDCVISIIESINRINIPGITGFEDLKKSMIENVKNLYVPRNYVFTHNKPLSWFEDLGYLQKFEEKLIQIRYITTPSISFRQFINCRETYLCEIVIPNSEELKCLPFTDEAVKAHTSAFRKIMEEYIFPSQRRYMSFLKEDEIANDRLKYDEFIGKFVSAFVKPYLWNDKSTVEWLYNGKFNVAQTRNLRIDYFIVDYINRIFTPGTSKYCHYAIRVLQTLLNPSYQQNETIRKLVVYAESKKASLMSQTSYYVLTLEDIDQFESTYKTEIGNFLEDMIRSYIISSRN